MKYRGFTLSILLFLAVFAHAGSDENCNTTTPSVGANLQNDTWDVIKNTDPEIAYGPLLKRLGLSHEIAIKKREVSRLDNSAGDNRCSKLLALTYDLSGVNFDTSIENTLGVMNSLKGSGGIIKWTEHQKWRGKDINTIDEATLQSELKPGMLLFVTVPSKKGRTYGSPAGHVCIFTGIKNGKYGCMDQNGSYNSPFYFEYGSYQKFHGPILGYGVPTGYDDAAKKAWLERDTKTPSK